jgi:hypothetical protein
MRSRAAQVEDAALGPEVLAMLQMEVPPMEPARLVSRARARGARTVLNLAPATPLPEDALRALDLLIVNEHEAAWLAERLGCGADAVALRAALGGGPAVAVTLGEAGAEAASAAGIARAPAFPVATVDTTGAGDCWCGVLAAALEAGAPLEKAMLRASAAAAITCTRPGAAAAMPNAAEIDASSRPPADPSTRLSGSGPVGSSGGPPRGKGAGSSRIDRNLNATPGNSETASVTSQAPGGGGGGKGACRPWVGRPRQPSGGAMLGRRRHWAWGYLQSRWALFAGAVCWISLAGCVFFVWLAPPAAPRRFVPAGPTGGPVAAASPRAAAAAVPPSVTEPSAAADADAAVATAGGLRLATRPTVAAACGADGPSSTTTTVCGSDAEPEVRREPVAERKRPGPALAAPAAQAAVVIRHRKGSAAGREAAQLIADEARRTGVRVVGIRPVPEVPDRREVHYLRDGDAAEGKRLASRLRDRWGNAWKVREVRPAMASQKATAALAPPPHTLEVWLPHR